MVTKQHLQHLVPWLACVTFAACGNDLTDASDLGLVSAQLAAGRGADDGDKDKDKDCKRKGSCGGKGGSEPKLIDVKLKFQARIGKNPFACGKEYVVGTSGTTMTPADLRLNFQDIALVREDGTQVPINLDVNDWQGPNHALLDFEDATGKCAEYGTTATRTMITGKVPEGKYTGIAFTNGVPEELNHGDPATAPEPLKSADMLWSWLVGYRFTQIELVQAVPEGEPFVDAWLHVGSTACSGDPEAGTVTCAKPNRNRVVLQKFDWSKDTIVVDPGQIWADQDLSVDVGCHSAGEACPGLFANFGLDFATGQPQPAQKVYRVQRGNR